MSKTSRIKESIILKVLNKGNKTYEQIAEENNVGYSNLMRWLKAERQKNSKVIDVKRLTNKQKLQHVIASAGLTEELLSVYCIKNEAYRHQMLFMQQSLLID